MNEPFYLSFFPEQDLLLVASANQKCLFFNALNTFIVKLSVNKNENYD